MSEGEAEAGDAADREERERERERGRQADLPHKFPPSHLSTAATEAAKEEEKR